MFKIIPQITNPIAFFAFFIALLTLITLSIIRHKNKDLSNGLLKSLFNGFFILSLIIVLSFCFILIKNAISQSKKNQNIEGVVYVDGKLTEGVTIIVPQIDKSSTTNRSGKYKIEVSDDELKQDSNYLINFTYSKLKIDTNILVRANRLFNYFYLSNQIKKNDTILKKEGNNINVSTPTETNKIENTYRILPTNLEKLERILKRDNFKKKDYGAKYIIDITHTGQIQDLGDNLYRYNGGNLLLKVNGIECKKINELNIFKTANVGNDKEFVETEISKQIQTLCNLNSQKIFNELKICLK